jgi:hypothetical protein
MKQLALLFLAVILAAQPFKKVQAAVELPAGSRLAVQSLRSAGNRRLLDDTVVSDYTAWCTPSRGELLGQDVASTSILVWPFELL